MDVFFKIKGPYGDIAKIDVPDPSIIRFPKDEVSEVNFLPYFPGNPYLETDVAKHWGHPCYGSGSFFVKRNDGTTRIVSPIFFGDENTTQNPFNFGGLKQWNTEFWLYTEGETNPKPVKKLPNYEYVHQIGKTDWIEIEASGSSFRPFKYRIEWKSI